MLRSRLAIAAAFVVAGLVRAALAQEQLVDSPERDRFGRPVYCAECIIDKPMYDPEAKRYFALVWSNPQNIQGHSTWGAAEKDVQQFVFHGVHARLAIVDTLEVHEFLLGNFHPHSYIWIGLRYLCKEKQLQWVDGRLWKPGDFQAWDARWNQDVYFCGSDQIVSSPIAYSESTFRWIGKGPGKGYPWAFVEFPTGGP